MKMKTSKGRAQPKPSQFDKDIDVHNLPDHWKDTKHEESGTAIEHLDVPTSIIDKWPLRQDEILNGPIQFTVGENIGSKIHEAEMAKIMPGTILSLDVDKWGPPHVMMT